MKSLRCYSWLPVVCFCAFARSAAAQELEPGAYSVSPVGINLFNAGYTFNRGDVNFDPALPVTDARARISTLALSLGRVISLAGRSATVLVSVPIVGGHVEGTYLGQFTEVNRTGLGDMRLRLGVNIYGAPALRMPEFAKTPPPRTNFSAGLMVVAPTGQYDPMRVINLGNNRWAFKPEVAFIRTNGPWMVEFYAGAWLFTANDDFVGGHIRTQDAMPSSQINVRYTFKPSLWLSGNANYYRGGRTSLDGKANLDLQTNSRVGATLVMPYGPRSSFRIAVSDGAYTTIGADFLGLSVSFQRAF
jgi:outer membrane putative beta-barrel porin/alpha-amylase